MKKYLPLFSLFSFLFFSFAARAEIQKEVLVFPNHAFSATF